MRSYLTGNFLRGLLLAGVPEEVLWGPKRPVWKGYADADTRQRGIETRRSVLRVVTKPEKEGDEIKQKLVIPLDEYPGTGRLPFRMTKKMMAETAFWGQNQTSFKSAEKIMEEKFGAPQALLALPSAARMPFTFHERIFTVLSYAQ
jgi:hypothetical protein